MSWANEPSPIEEEEGGMNLVTYVQNASGGVRIGRDAAVQPLCRLMVTHKCSIDLTVRQRTKASAPTRRGGDGAREKKSTATARY